MITKCPSCGAIIVIQTHAKRGKGMQRAKKMRRLNQNLQSIGIVISESKEPLTVGEIRKTLYDGGIKRTRGQWNQSLVQVDTSRLVGRGLVTMLKHKHQKPRYYMKTRQREWFNQILGREGRIQFCVGYSI